MALDPYAPCPCGSGKRFKWCCQPIHVEIDRALHQDAEGQHETALKLMAEVVQRHPANPEALGRYAELLYRNNRVEDAENALQKAFEISPNYPFGHLLRGLFRYHEGEIAGALLLFRKAAEAYHPEAVDQLGQVYMLIADCEMKLNRPVAARAAMQIALRHHANDEELRKNYDGLFGPQSQLPATARQEHAFRSPAESTAGTRRETWNRVLGAGATRLSDAVRGFEQLTAEDASDAAAWYNLGLARAWLGENAAALEALDRYVELEGNETAAAAAWALAEVLRLGQGLEDQADYREHSVTYQLRDPRPLFALLQEWEKDHRLVGAQADQQQGILSALVLEKPQLVTSTPGGGKPLRLGAYLLLIGQVLRFRHSQKEPLDRVCAEVQQRAAPGLSEGLERVAHANFSDVVLEALVFPVGVTDREVGAGQIREHAAAYFEDAWIHRPLRSLNHTPPIDAAGHRTLRKKLLGVIQFLQECATGGIIENYDFDRLRRKLGLLGTAVPASGEATGGAAVDVSGLGAAELAALAANSLSLELLEQAHQAALRLDAQELAGKFAKELITRPPDATRPDRAPWYFSLSQRAVTEGHADEALSLITEGERYDREHNEGRRGDEFALRRGQIHFKRGEVQQAQEVFEQLLARDPSNQRARGSAAEGMLSLREGPLALRFAEEGLATARQRNDRDSEQYFLELVAAAKKQVSG